MFRNRFFLISLLIHHLQYELKFIWKFSRQIFYLHWRNTKLILILWVLGGFQFSSRWNFFRLSNRKSLKSQNWLYRKMDSSWRDGLIWIVRVSFFQNLIPSRRHLWRKLEASLSNLPETSYEVRLWLISQGFLYKALIYLSCQSRTTS